MIAEMTSRVRALTASMTTGTPVGGFTFSLPHRLEAREPPEARGLARDEVRLMVSSCAGQHIEHTIFRDFPRFPDPGDVVVINTSRTLNAALPATTPEGLHLELHLSTQLPGCLWLVELRRYAEHSTVPFHGDLTGMRLTLPGDGGVEILARYGKAGIGIEEQNGADAKHAGGSDRLWLATFDLPNALHDYLDHHGSPIRYHYVRGHWPIEYYQTAYATESGSAEMPSAGRAFTHDLIPALVAKGVHVVPVVLHTGVSSLEEHEPPYEEYYRVPSETARLLNDARSRSRRIVAVGTTVVRALETVTDEDGATHPGEGWTKLVVTPDRQLRSVNALVTGLHEPRATHLAMLEALAGREHIRRSYAEALKEEYLWHEFGDLHLILA